MTSDHPRIAYLTPCDPARPQPGRDNGEEADRSENAVLTAYLFHLAAKGHRVLRHRILTDPVLASTDLFDATAGEVVMACHRSDYGALTAAYGVISDCVRFFSPAHRALLFTAEPGPVAKEFLSHHKIIAIWPEGESFVRADPKVEQEVTAHPSQAPDACHRCGGIGFLARATEWVSNPALCVDCHEALGTQQARDGHQCLDGCPQPPSHTGLCRP
ncbi:hypothetical protein [Streptomyces sp. NPDC058861]|uniref:hypothetical protein n=1 Tax=Streptomyces sp. NPDC058861 TaxID=3346653 RepID=UPI0036C59C3B